MTVWPYEHVRSAWQAACWWLWSLVLVSRFRDALGAGRERVAEQRPLGGERQMPGRVTSPKPLRR